MLVWLFALPKVINKVLFKKKKSLLNFVLNLLSSRLWQRPTWRSLLLSSGSGRSRSSCAPQTWSRVWRTLWGSSRGGTRRRCCSRCAPRCSCRSTAGKPARHGARALLLSLIIVIRTSAARPFRFMGLMPTYMEKDGVLSTKFVCFYKREEGSTLPAVQATVVLLDPEFGNVKAVSPT